MISDFKLEVVGEPLLPKFASTCGSIELSISDTNNLKDSIPGRDLRGELNGGKHTSDTQHTHMLTKRAGSFQRVL